MSFFSPESSLLSDHLVPRNDGSIELMLDMKPSCDLAAFVRALRSCSYLISAVHVHKMFLKDLTEEEESAVFDSLHNLKEIHVSFVSLPIKLLANLLLRSSEQLQVLSLDRIVLLTAPTDSPSHEDAVFFSALQGLQSLQDFHFSLSTTATAPEGQKLFFQIDDEFDTLFQSLTGIQALKKIYVSIGKNFASNSDIKPRTLQSLLQSSAVQDLTLVHFPLHKEHCEAILSSGVCLDSLSLVKAGLGDEGAMVLANGLAENKVARKNLSLPGNKITNIGGAMIAKALSTNNQNSLEVLDLHSNQFTSAFGKDIAAMLTRNNSITFLDMSSNKLKDAGVKSIVSVLHQNDTLQQLTLFDTHITDKSCEAVARLLRFNTTLKRLNMYNNEKITTQGIQVLAQALKQHNYDLERLEVSLSNKQDGDFGLEMYLRLNREYSRHQMITDPATTEPKYVDGIHKAVANNDVSSIYYFLQSKPSLCC